MSDVAFKDLCIDVTAGGGRPSAVAHFWALALDQPLTTADDGMYCLDPATGTPASRRIWVNEVPEAPAGKSRVHLDLRVAAGDPAPLLAAGASVVRAPTDDDAWWVLADPDGVALCVFPPHPLAPDALGPFELVVDSADPLAIATWWAARTGGTVGQRPGAPFAWVEGADGFPFMFWVFAPVPEPKVVKNRVHWDVLLVDATVDDLVAASATLVRPPDEVDEWWVLTDPEGNEFCAFR